MAFFIGEKFVCGDPDPWVNGKSPKAGEFCLADYDHVGHHEPGVPPAPVWPNPGWATGSPQAPPYPADVRGFWARRAFTKKVDSVGAPRGD